MLLIIRVVKNLFFISKSNQYLVTLLLIMLVILIKMIYKLQNSREIILFNLYLNPYDVSVRMLYSLGA
ncbi:hypothetical protein SAMN05421755_101236 [Nitrosomonas sp. Nm33]|nr:hypothetical protein SAMN05421755_101236 [Nitrosomonas sp. Nm33]